MMKSSMGGRPLILGLAISAIHGAARAQTAAPATAPSQAYGGKVTNQAFSLIFPDSLDGHAHVVGPVDPLPVTCNNCGGGGGGGGGGAVTQSGAWNVGISNFPATQPVSGAVSVSNFPATQPVSGAITVSGGVSVSNFPATQPVSGAVTLGGSLPGFATTPTFNCGTGCGSSTFNGVLAAGSAIVGRLSAVDSAGVDASDTTNHAQRVTIVAGLPATQSVSGSISVSNFPSVQVVGGSAAAAFTQGTGTAGANSANVYVGGGVATGVPSAGVQAAVQYNLPTTPGGVPVDLSIPTVAASTNGSASVTAGNTFQVLLAATAARKGCAVQNTSADVEYIDVADATGTATKPRSFQLPPGSYWYCSQISGLVISDLLSITAPTTGDTFVLTSQ